MKNKKIQSLSLDQLASSYPSKSSNQFSPKLSHKLSRACAYVCIFLIKLLRPLLGPNKVCPFTVGCTEYALMELEHNSLLAALKNITIRLLRCNPLTNLFT